MEWVHVWAGWEYPETIYFRKFVGGLLGKVHNLLEYMALG